MRAAGSKVVYFAGYKKIIDRYKVDQIEAAADVVVWACDEAPGFTPGRPQDKQFRRQHRRGDGRVCRRAAGRAAGEPLADAERMIVIGSDRMMAAVGAARHGVLKPYVKDKHVAIGSINSPMQCMMKEVCAQCLQPHATR